MPSGRGAAQTGVGRLGTETSRVAERPAHKPSQLDSRSEPTGVINPNPVITTCRSDTAAGTANREQGQTQEYRDHQGFEGEAAARGFHPNAPSTRLLANCRTETASHHRHTGRSANRPDGSGTISRQLPPSTPDCRSWGSVAGQLRPGELREIGRHVELPGEIGREEAELEKLIKRLSQVAKQPARDRNGLPTV